jgi:hypothetical protein
MTGTGSQTRFRVATLVLCLFSASSLAVTWQNSVEISNNASTKSMNIYGASDGGAHVKWNQDNGVKYRRVYANGAWGPIQTVRPPGNNIVANGDIIEAGDGSIWISWEDWPDGLECAAAQSTDGGATWTTYLLGSEKFPELARLGESGSEVMLSAHHAANDTMDYWLWNGSSWSSQLFMASANSEYWVTGKAWSPYDGRVWRTYGNDYNGTHLYLKAFDDDTHTWGSDIRMTETAGFFAWPAVAANEFGQVCVVWERNEMIYMRFYDPTTGWAPVQGVDSGRLASITHVPGKHKFYLTYTDLPSQEFVEGRVIEDGNVGPSDRVSAGLGNAFTVVNAVSADANGRLHCVWEYWASGEPETYYSYTDDLTGPDPEPYLQNAYVSQPTLLADGATEYQVTLEAGDGNGGEDLHDMRIMFNRDFTNAANTRGYLIWGMTEADVRQYDSGLPIMGAATGGGYWSFDDSDWGYQYITPTGCSTSVNGTTRTVTWTFKVAPSWGYAGPQSGNYIGMFVRDSTGLYVNWQDSSDLFGYTFSVQANPLPDYDSDGDVDQADFAVLQRCLTGSGQPVMAGCEMGDLDQDNDADIYDVAIFNLCSTAPEIPADASCRDLPVENMLPDQAFDPVPGGGSTGIALDTDLSWSAGTGATSHDVYFGTNTSPAFQGNVTATTFDPGGLQLNQTYYWRVDEVNAQGTTTGQLWSFTTTDVVATNLNRYQFANLSTGSEYYLDRDYTITAMPSTLEGLQGIKTNNDDKARTESVWITFDLLAEAKVYVAYDKRGLPENGGTLPNWLGAFTQSTMTVSVTDSYASPMALFEKTFPSGQVALGGNKQSPASGADANYFVLIKPTGN